MNNIFLSQPDPLLQNTQVNQPQFYQLPIQPEYTLKDWVGELDETTKGLDSETIKSLGENETYVNLSTQFQQVIQQEIMLLIKNRINSRPEIINNIKQQLSIIQSIKGKINEEQRKNITELNDYMKNYSHMTFDEYRKIKEEPCK